MSAFFPTSVRHGEDQEASVLPGVKPVLELLRATPEQVDAVFLRKGRHGKDRECIVDLCRDAGVRFALLDPASFARVYAGHCQGVVARLFDAGFTDLDSLLSGVMDSPLPLVLVLDQIQDPGNAGTLARTLYALGGAGIVTPRHNGVYLGAAAAKAAAGALDKLPVSKVANLGQAVDSAKALGFTIYGAAAGCEAGSAGGRKRQGAEMGPNRQEKRSARTGNAANNRVGGGQSPPDCRQGVADNPLRSILRMQYSGGAEKNVPDRERSAPGKPVLDVFSCSPRLPAMLILGSEADGLRASMEKRCDCLVRIPMLRDFNSLNVAQAGGIIIGCFAHLAGRTGKTR